MNSHLVQFCSEAASIVDEAAVIVQDAEAAGEAVLAILDRERLQQLRQRLGGERGDGASWFAADAVETLAQFTDDGSPDPERFRVVVGGLVSQARGAEGRALRVLSELSATLAGNGHTEGAEALERLWHGLAEEQALQVQCVVPMRVAAAVASPQWIEAMCSLHSRVVPCGLAPAAAVDAALLSRTVATLQLRVAALEAELQAYRNSQASAEKARRDMAALAQAYTELERVANLDPLTGLYNRRVFLDRLEHALERAKRRRNSFALLLVDLDDFKRVNDRHGHEAGDRLLREVAARLGLCARGSDTVCRLGGDEFTVIMEDCSLVEAALVAQRIVDTLQKEIMVGEESMLPTASVGVSVYPQHAADAASLIRSADQAMYRAKGQGKARYEDSGPAPLV